MRSVRDIAVIYRGLLSELERRQGGAGRAWASAAGSRPRWRRMAPADLSQPGAGRRRWASSRRRATSSTSPSPATSTTRAPASTTRRRSTGLRRRALDRPARDVGHLPRDELPHRLEALHVQPDAAASAGRRARAGAGRVGRRGQGRAARAPASAMPRRCPTPSSRSSRRCGHCVDMEQPEALAKLVTDFIGYG